MRRGPGLLRRGTQGLGGHQAPRAAQGDGLRARGADRGPGGLRRAPRRPPQGAVPISPGGRDPPAGRIPTECGTRHLRQPGQGGVRMSPPRVKSNPFPGLRPFTQEEDYLFFGREEQTIDLLQRLGSHRFVAVVGTSGSGKSSLVRCGLLSEVLGGRMLGAGASWEVAVTHPGGNPLALLADALLDAGLYDRGAENARENLLATLGRSHFGLVEAVKQAALPDGANFLLVVDQFEEIFRFHEAGQTQQEMANEFVSLLLEAAAQKQAPIYV